MPMTLRTLFARRVLVAAVLLAVCSPAARSQNAARLNDPVAIRVATFNIEDLRTSELREPYSDRVRAAAEIIQRIRPNVLLVNEISYDVFGGPSVGPNDEPGQNASRLAALLAEPAAAGLEPLRMKSWMDQVNTGRASGFDLNGDGRVVSDVPPQPASNPDGTPSAQTAEGRAYGEDAWGFGTFPGQYGMAILVDERLEIVEDRIRTFRLFPWDFMPGNLMPTRMSEAGETESWYGEDAGELFRLSSKSHWDVPVRMPNGAVVRFLCSHPTPPAFDGDEARNKRRNHDEIRFWSDYVDNAAYIIDDNRVVGGIPSSAHFVVLGDLNADPDEGGSINNPIGSLLLSSRHFAPDPRPIADTQPPTTGPELVPDDTASFGMRVDYVLPSDSLTTLASGVWRLNPTSGPFPSDHFPVWTDIVIPAPQ